MSDAYFIKNFLCNRRLLRIFSFAIYLCILCLCGLVSCGGGGGGGDNDDEEPVPTSSFTRLIHVIPDSPKIDFIVDDVRIARGIDYGKASTYQPVESGSRNIKINAANSSFTVLEDDLSVDDDTSLSLFAIDFLARLDVIVIEEDRTHPLAGNTNVRIVHAAPTAPAVDVYLTSRNADLSTATPFLTDLEFKDVSTYVTIPSGDYRARVTIAGTTTVLIDSGLINIPSRGIVTVIAADAPGGGAPFELSFITDLLK